MKIYLAALEGQMLYLYPTGLKVRNGFISYYTFSGRNPALVHEKVKKIREVVTATLVTDSGAHSFFAEKPEAGLSASGHSRKSKYNYSPEDYFAKYLDFVKRNNAELDYFVELDIGELVGQEQVEKWREVLKSEGLYQKCITCYHPSIMDLDYFEYMCKHSESKYLAVEGDRPMQRKGRLDYTTLIKLARKHSCKLHGFAMTKPDALSTFPFYSVDSSSWNAFIVWGKSGLIKKDKLVKKIDQLAVRKERGRTRLYREEIAAWTELEDYYTALWKRRGIDYGDHI